MFATHAELSPMDVLMLKGDADPRTRAIMTGLLTLHEVPDWARLVDAFERASHAVPRMRHRVLGAILPGASPEWCPDPEFDLGYHVRRIGVSPGGGMPEVLEMAASMSTAPLDAARPLWDATLVEGLDDGSAVLILRAHHALTDGLGAVAVLAGLVDLEPTGHEREGLGEAELPGPQSEPGTARRVRLGRAWLAQTRAATRRSRSVLGAGVRLARDPVGIVRATGEMGGSLRRVATRPAARPSELLRERSRRREFRMVEVPLDELRAASKASGCSVNDAYLAALLGGFRRYHQAFGAAVNDVPLAFPMDMRANRDTSAGNHISMARLSGPASISDPIERMVAIHQLISSIRDEPAVHVIGVVADLLQHVPSGLAIRGLTAHAQQVDLHASNLMGAPFGVYLAGVRVSAMVPFGPLTGVPVMSVLISYDGVCSVGLTLDPAAVTDPDLFAECVREGFEEVVAVARTAAPLVATR